MTKSIQIALVAFSVSLQAILAPVYAHEFYSQYCCDEKDCKPVPCDSLVETADGVEYILNGTKYTAPKSNVYPSEDSRCHFCIFGGVGRCAYVQQGS